ncbi:right-handed parallel beta-helix repeat-containing protein [Flavobacteriales bacterium]|nr:right-handed parallel beta-helix repeat-containing protein [Flavobacteriales bacterium]
MWLDDFELTTDFYPSADIDISNYENFNSSSPLHESLSTGGFQLVESTYNGDFHSVSDTLDVVLENSAILGNETREKDSHGLGLYANHVNLTTENSIIAGHSLDGIHIESTTTIWNSVQDVISDNGSEGLTVTGTLTLDADSTFVTGNGSHGIEALGSNSDATLYQSQLKDNGGDGIRLTGSGSDLEADYSFVRDNGGDAVEMGSSGTLRMDNCLLGYNDGYGIRSSGAVDLNYMNILHNGGYGIRTSQFSKVDNSIIWFNGGVPQMITDNTYAVSYTNVQGINALLTSTDFAWGNGCIGTDPVLADDQGHLDPYSPCVDGGMPWEQDAHIPYGLGSSRADMGMYGGPANEYWGGQAPPDGAVQITDVFDIPQDQGGFVGMHFTASPFDFGGLGFNVTHYSIWRDLALGSDTPADVSDGNWEEIGTVPAQGFNQYGYTAATLMDAYPGETACLTSFIVIAHTTDDNIYWVSAVAAACSEDNLAPAIPDLGGMVLADADDEAVALLSWALPEEEDYAYTVVTGDNGFNGTVSNGDTLITDASLEPGALVAYEAVHFDIHGNASDAAILALEAPLGEDLIALREGWNLISSDRIPDVAALETVMASLTPGNLQYVIAFDAGVQFYDPSGLSFLNTLSYWKEGYGHWVKVAADDTLRVQGSRLGDDFMPGLAEGWNLVGYAAEAPAAPGNVFADLEATGDLLYVTGFDQGVQVYDPNGLPFLNTLTEMRNGFGYWVKSAVASDGDVLAPLSEDKTPLQVPSPRYDVVNGMSELKAYAGEFVDVVNGWGVTVARLPILEGGHLMTTAIFGDDPATGMVEGLADGETLHFAFRGAVANETMVFGGDMAHKTLALTFEEVDAAMSVFPNPAMTSSTLRFTLEQDAQVQCTILDAQGREAWRHQETLSTGIHRMELPVELLESGTYMVELWTNGRPHATSQLVLMD